MRAQVEVLEREQEGHLIKCRCRTSAGQVEGDTVFLFVRSHLPVSTEVGCHITIHSPWRHMQLPGCSIPLIFVYAASDVSSAP